MSDGLWTMEGKASRINFVKGLGTTTPFKKKQLQFASIFGDEVSSILIFSLTENQD